MCEQDVDISCICLDKYAIFKAPFFIFMAANYRKKMETLIFNQNCLSCF